MKTIYDLSDYSVDTISFGINFLGTVITQGMVLKANEPE